MARIIVSENVTLDGVVQDPTGEEGTSGGGWFAHVGPADREESGRATLQEAEAATAFLMGRRTYEFLASRWPARTGALADRLNSIPKHVVSGTLKDPLWPNTTVIEEDAMGQVSQLKRQLRGDIVVPASFMLVRALLMNDLADQINVTVYPRVVGSGARLFEHLIDSVSLRLIDNGTLGDNLTRATYAVARSDDPAQRRRRKTVLTFRDRQSPDELQD